MHIAEIYLWNSPTQMLNNSTTLPTCVLLILETCKEALYNFISLLSFVDRIIWAHEIFLIFFFGIFFSYDHCFGKTVIICGSVFNTVIVMSSIYICPFLSIPSFPLPLLNYFSSSSFLVHHDSFLSFFPSHPSFVFSKLPETCCSQILNGSSLPGLQSLIQQNPVLFQSVSVTLFSAVVPHPMLQLNWNS